MNKQEPGYWIDADLSDRRQLAAFESVPLQQRGLPGNVHALLKDACAIDPDKIAIHYFTDGTNPRESATATTYRELWSRINQTANLFHSLGVGPSDVIAMLSPIVPDALFALWGGQAAGIVLPINWMLEPVVIAELIRASRAKVLVAYVGDVDIDLWYKVKEVASHSPELEVILGIGERGTVRYDGSIDTSAKLIDYSTIIDQFPGDRLTFSRRIRSDDTAALFHTGGTTGVPKLARHTHGGQVFVVWASAVAHRMTSSETRCCGLPLFHVTGALLACLLPIARGGSVALMTSSGWRHPSVVPNFWRIVQAYEITAAMVVPAIVTQLLRVPLDGANISSLTVVGSGAAPLSAHMANAFEQQFGVAIKEGYGMTETTAVNVLTPRNGRSKPGSVGLPLPYQQVRIAKLNTTAEVEVDCGPGEPGVLLLRGPAIFPGYLDEKSNRNLWVEGAWLNTGDLAYLDEDGYLWITGRAKDLIIRGGHNIDPRMVEEALYGHPAVSEVAVVGAPDARSGEIPVVYVSLKPGSRCTDIELLAFAEREIPERAAIPKVCYILPALPKTSVGKLQKNVLRADAAERVIRAALETAGIGAIRSVHLEDKGHAGLLCVLDVDEEVNTIESIRQSVDKALSPFTVKYQFRNGQ